jgi:hypothetical protein
MERQRFLGLIYVKYRRASVRDNTQLGSMLRRQAVDSIATEYLCDPVTGQHPAPN